jgi:hypothetical protein
LSLAETGFPSIRDDHQNDRDHGSENRCQEFVHNVLENQAMWDVLTMAKAHSNEHPLARCSQNLPMPWSYPETVESLVSVEMTPK